MPATATTTPETEQRRLTLSAVLDRFGIGLALILLMVILAILSPQYFLTQDNLNNVARQSSVMAMLALGQFVVILTASRWSLWPSPATSYSNCTRHSMPRRPPPLCPTRNRRALC
jgi:hypothetical protein